MTEAEQGSNIITKGGSKYAITAQGWNSFKTEPGAGIRQEKNI